MLAPSTTAWSPAGLLSRSHLHARGEAAPRQGPVSAWLHRDGLHAGTAPAAAAAGSGCALATVSASGVGQWLLTQPICTCSTGPAVLSSRNRSVIRAERAALGTGDGAWHGNASLPRRSSPRWIRGWRTSPPLRMDGAGVGERCRRAPDRRAARHLPEVDVSRLSGGLSPRSRGAARDSNPRNRWPRASPGQLLLWQGPAWRTLVRGYELNRVGSLLGPWRPCKLGRGGAANTWLRDTHT